MHIDIHRLLSAADGTISAFKVFEERGPGNPILELCGIEQPWRDNRPMESCISAGEYYLDPHKSRGWGKTWAFVGGSVSHWQENFAVRYACIIHRGVSVRSVKGCYALGTSWDRDSRLRIYNSVEAMRQLKKVVSPSEPHTCVIRWF